MSFLPLLLQAGPVGDPLLERGLLGAVAFALLSSTLWFFRRMVKENDELRGQRDTMVIALRDVVPLLERSNQIHQLRQAADELNRSEVAQNRAAIEQVGQTCASMREELQEIRITLKARRRGASDD